jgi:hypothetical protein
MSDPYSVAHLQYLQHRHEIALKLLAWHDSQQPGERTGPTKTRSGTRHIALAERKYVAAAECTSRRESFLDMGHSME